MSTLTISQKKPQLWLTAQLDRLKPLWQKLKSLQLPLVGWQKPPQNPGPRLLLLILMLTIFGVLLSGCARDTAVHTRTVLLVPPSSYTQDTPAAEPPTAEALINAWSKYPKARSVWEARFLLMYDAWNAQTDQVGMCNIDKRHVRDWSSKQAEMEKSHDSGGGSD